jgi:hypothetical protein
VVVFNLHKFIIKFHVFPPIDIQFVSDQIYYVKNYFFNFRDCN